MYMNITVILLIINTVLIKLFYSLFHMTRNW